ncbi:serine/threonine protein kinase, CMGC, CDC2/CDK sub, partial [Ceratobasidium sp. 392]
MSNPSASLPKRPHSPSPNSNSPPAKRRAHSPEEGELDDAKPHSQTRSPSSSPSVSRDDTPGAGTRSTSPSEPGASSKNSKHAFPFSNRDRDRDRERKRGGGDFYRPTSPPPRRHNHTNPGMFDSYIPDDRRNRSSRSRSRSRSRVDSNSPVTRRHRLPPRPASPPPQPPLHTSFERNGYERNGGGGPGYGNDARNGGPGVYDRWQPPPPNPSSYNGRGRDPGRTRNPYTESGPARGSTPNANGGGLRPLDTPGAPMADERVGIEQSRMDSWEPRSDRERGRSYGRDWERERGRDESRGWDRDRDRDRGKNRIPLANIPPNPPQVPVDPKITDTLNDTIARIEREANEAEAKKGSGGEGKEGKEGKENSGGKPRVLRRSPDQEMQAYGRKFVGTSQLKDYAISEKLGEGTFGEVHKATHIVSKRSVALKRILMHNEKEGVPVTALREIKILKMLSHPSVVTVCDMV